MKITRKEDKFILGSTVVDSTVLKGTPGLEKQFLTNALNLLKFPQRFGLTQDKGKELKFTSDIEQSGRILDVFSDAVWEYNPKTTVYEKKGKLSEVFNNKSIIFNENTGKTYYLKDGKFKKISDLNFKVSRGDEVVRELENRVQDVEKRMGDSGNRFSIVSALPANPDKDTLYIVIGEGQIDDSDVTGLDLSELQSKVSECITDNLHTRTTVQEMVTDQNTQNERLDALEETMVSKASVQSVSDLENRTTTAESNIGELQNNLSTLTENVNTKFSVHDTDISGIKSTLENLASSDTLVELSNRVSNNANNIDTLQGNVQTNSSDIADIKDQLENLATSETLTNLTARVQTNEDDIADIKSDLEDIASSEVLVQLGNRVTTNEGNITSIQNTLENLSPSDIAGLEEFIQTHENNGNIKVVSQIPEEPEPDTLYIISNEGESFTLTAQDILEIRSGISSNGAKITALESELDDTKTEFNQAISDLDTKVNNIDVSEQFAPLTNRVSTLEDKYDNLDVSAEVTTVVTEQLNPISERVTSLENSVESLENVDVNGLIDAKVNPVNEKVDNNTTLIAKKVQIVETLPQEVENDVLYLISEEPNENNISLTQKDIKDMIETISNLSSLVQSQQQTIDTHELMLENQANIIKAQTDVINRMKSKLDMIDFDTLTLDNETYDIVVKK